MAMAGDKLNMSAYFIQTTAAISIAIQSLLTGFIYGWPSTTVVNFKSSNTVLSSEMTTLQVSLLGSITNIGALVVTPICGYIMDKIGRKYSTILFGLPFVICWSIILITRSIPFVIAAVGIAGVGVAGLSVASIYITEICHESIRGALTSSVATEYYLGLLSCYTIGGYLTYLQAIYVYLLLSVLNIVLLLLLKESPVFLMMTGKEQAAAKSIAFYRRVESTSKEVGIEIAKIKLQLVLGKDRRQEDHTDELTTSEGLVGELPPVEAKAVSAWTFLKKSRSSRRALFAVLTVTCFTILMGSVVFQVYAELFFQEAIPTMSSNMCSIFLALDYLIATLLCSSLLDIFGRKFILTTTSIASGIFCLLLGTQIQLHWAPHWFTAICIYGYAFFINLGVAVVPFVLAAEVFLPEIRGFCNSMSIGCMWMMNFVALFIFNPLVDSIGIGPLFYGFSLVCFISATYSQFCLPETKGLTVDAIQLAFLGKKEMSESKICINSC